MNSKKSLLALSLLGLAMTATGQNRISDPNRAAKPADDLPTINLFSATYRLASYNQRPNPMWEFTTNNEDINAWSSLVTLIDRTEAKTVAEMDRLSEGIMAKYKSNGGTVLTAKTLKNEAGASFNYMLVAFEEPAKKRYELNFVKIGMGAKNATIMIVGVRVSDANDYKAKTKEFLDKRSGQVGMAVGNFVVPDMSGWPRREF